MTADYMFNDKLKEGLYVVESINRVKDLYHIDDYFYIINPFADGEVQKVYVEYKYSKFVIVNNGKYRWSIPWFDLWEKERGKIL